MVRASNYASSYAENKRIDQVAQIRSAQAGADALVNTSCPAYNRMRQRWDEGIDDFLDGDDAIQARSSVHLPQYPAETKTNYERRISGTVLLPGFKDAVDRIAVRPFAKPIKVTKPVDEDGVTIDLPHPLSEIERDVDGKGSDLTALGRSLFADGTARGPCFLWIDAPSVMEGTTSEDVDRLRLWPRIKRIPPRNVFAWVEGENEAGDPVVTAVRFVEMRQVKAGRFGVMEVPIIRELYAPEDGMPGGWIVYTWNAEAEAFTEESSGEHDFDELPFLYAQFGEANGLVECRPPLYQVFRMNLAHLRSQSRQTQYVESVRIATRFLSGVTQEEIEAGIEIGPFTVKGSTRENARLTFAEHSGAAAQTGWDDLDRWQLAMAQAGTEPLRTKTGNPTATGKAIDTAKSSCDVESWVRVLESLLERAYRMAARWLELDIPEGFGIDIWSEFSLGLRADTDLQHLLAMAERGHLSPVTLIQEAQRRDLISDRVDAHEEMERVAAHARQQAIEFGAGVFDGIDDDPSGDPEAKDPAAAA